MRIEHGGISHKKTTHIHTQLVGKDSCIAAKYASRQPWLSIKTRCLIYENITGYLKNHWTKHRLVCTHSDAFSMLMPNMGTTLSNSEIFENFSGKKIKVLIVFDSHAESVTDVGQFIQSE